MAIDYTARVVTQFPASVVAGTAIVITKENGVYRIALDLDSYGTDTGSILVRTSTSWIALPPGSNGQVLTSNGPGQVPSWS